MSVYSLVASLVLGISMCIYPIHEREIEVDLFKQFAIDVGMEGDWISYLNAVLAQMYTGPAYKTTDTNILFEHYPELKNKLPYISLAHVPTPVEKLAALSKRYGVDVYIKRDDLTSSLYGGNKVRKLEYLLAQARACGATKVMTFGCAGSNHAVATAVQAHRMGMDAICMLKHQPPSSVVQRNLLMHLNYGSELHYSANNDIRKLNAFIVWLDHYKHDGQAPYIIPTGGSNVIGTIGFVQAAFELAEQIKQGVMPKPSHIYLPCGSCATTAGLLLGCKAAGLEVSIIAVAVEPDENSLFAPTIDRLFKETNQYLRSFDNSFPECTYTDADLRIERNFTGPEYGIFTDEGVKAAATMAKIEGIQLEGTYTAKACAAMLADIKQHKRKRGSKEVILFWNTYCGFELTKQLVKTDYRELPRCLHDYFDDELLQPLEKKK